MRKRVCAPISVKRTVIQLARAWYLLVFHLGMCKERHFWRRLESEGDRRTSKLAIVHLLANAFGEVANCGLAPLI